VLIDKNDSEWFRKFRANRKVMQFVGLAKEIYQEAQRTKNIKAIEYLEKIQLSKNLSKIYNLS
jgi:hypothetical protein